MIALLSHPTTVAHFQRESTGLRSWINFQVDFRCPNLITSYLPTSLGWGWGLIGLPLSHCRPLEAMKWPLLCRFFLLA